MLKELFDRICEKADEARTPKIVSIPGDDRYVLLDGEKHELPPPRRRHTFFSLDSFVDAVNNYKGEGEINAGPTIWHDDEKIVAVINDADRRDFLALPLNFSEQFAALSKPKRLNQRELILFLKQKLADRLSPNLEPMVRRVQFTRTGDARGNIAHGKESLGKSIEAEIQAADQLPEVVIARVPVYVTTGCQMETAIRLSFDVDLEGQTFSLSPLADEIEKAIADVQGSIHELLCETSVPVFNGTANP